MGEVKAIEAIAKSMAKGKIDPLMGNQMIMIALLTSILNELRSMKKESLVSRMKNKIKKRE